MRITAMIEPNNDATAFDWWVKLEDGGRSYERRGSSEDYATGKADALTHAQQMHDNVTLAAPVKEFTLFDDNTKAVGPILPQP